MRASKLIQMSGLIAVLAASAMIFAVEVYAGDRGYSVEKSASDERDTFEDGPGDTFRIDKDGPEQDSHYDEDDPKWDEIDNSVNQEGEDN